MPQPQETLVGLLADRNVRMKHLTAGHSEQTLCPKCGGGRTREKSLSVTIDPDGDGAAMKCHRGSCGWAEGVRVRADRAAPHPRVIQKPKPATLSETENRPDWLLDFFAERHIGLRTVREFGIYATTRWFGEGDREHAHIVFPFTFGGEIVNRKFRPFPEKQPQAQEKDALPTLFNVDRLGEAPAEIIWVEGEPDVLAMFECGFPHAITLKDGAPKEATFRPEDLRFEAIRTHGDMLAKVPRIILAGDNDQPGIALREELARRLGRHRCWLVTWPEGCKDACDTLRLHGPEAVQEAVQTAAPYPISGLQSIKPGTLSDLRKQHPPTTMTTGTRASDEVIHLPTEGRLIIVTGYPGDGKTSWMRYVMIKTAINNGRRWAVFSPEMQPWEQFVAGCAEVYCEKPFWPVHGVDSMTDDDIDDAERWLAGRVTMLVCDSEDEAPTPDWILDRARATVLRDGTTDLLVDPWNEIDHQRGTMTETEYTGRTLQRFRAFGLRHGCNVWISAHPAKPMLAKLGTAKQPPGPYDISGSAHWFNKTDLGLTVFSPTPGVSELRMWKAKYRRFGIRGAVATMNYDAIRGLYSTPFASTSLMEAPENGRWGDV
jgi:twinkle protein